MTFTPGIWKKRVSKQLIQFGDELKKRSEGETPNPIYAELGAMTLWPLVEEAQGGVLMPAVLALMSIAGGGGGNLIAARLEKWKDRADEAEVYEWVAENAPKNPDLRDALDAIMVNFDVMARAEAGLDGEDRTWFSDALKKELQQLGNLARYKTEPPRLPLGSTNFEKIITENLYYIDKTMLIKEVLDEGEIILITRPRRFGKTLNQDMLRCFFEKSETDRKRLFNNLAISRDPACMTHQGSYPVIYLTFKDAKGKNWDSCLKDLKCSIIKEYRRHDYLMKTLRDDDKKRYRNIMNDNADEHEYAASIELLTGYLHVFYKERAIVLIDEYDTPIIEAYAHHYYDKAISFIRSMFGRALKDNAHIQKGVLTGILRIARESIFSELNNLRVFSMLDAGFSDKFGLTEAEVDLALDRFDLQDRRDEVARWYNGYSVAGRNIYNPWSIINFLKDRQTKAYWVNTSDNALVYDLVRNPEPLFQKKTKALLAGESIDAIVDENIVFPTLDKMPDNIWTVLFFSGYLTLFKEVDADLKRFEIAIPNHEVRTCFKAGVSRWMNNTIGADKLSELLHALVGGDVETFSERLQYFVKTIWSYYDAADPEPEKVYHAFFLGLLINLESKYEIRSNRESGYGRYDVMMAPRKPDGLGIVMEFKKAEKTESVEAALQSALDQIQKNEYETELKDRKIKNILLIAIALKGKQVKVEGIRLAENSAAP